jgi:hypothetical protein
MTLDKYFAGHEGARPLFEALRRMVETIGPSTVRVTRSQIAFRRRKAFAWAWVPGRYLRGKPAPLVLTLVLPSRHPSPRWKEIVEPASGHFTHHLELFSPQDLDEEVRGWLRDAWLRAD